MLRQHGTGDLDELPRLEVVRTKQTDQTGAALYGRVSGPKQKTIPGQLDVCRALCEARNWKVRYQLADQALKGDDPTRPGFQRLMDLAEERAIATVVVWKIDRLARSLAHAVAIEELLRKNGVAIVSCTEPIDTTTPIGRFLFGTLANAAQLEKDINRERIELGMYRQARDGRWTRSSVPLGFRLTKGHFLRVEPKEAVMIVQVYDFFDTKGSLNETAHGLNQSGAYHPRGEWTAERVRLVFENPLYCGRVVQSGVTVEKAKLAIVPPARWEQTRQRLASAPRRGRPASRSAREESIDRVFDQYFASLTEDANPL
ncbi:MAG: recombinase family protein [bacterium]